METPGVVAGPVRLWLKIENLAVLVAVVVLYSRLDGGWGLFALLFLAPDLAIPVYFVGNSAGAHAYNAVHNYLGPALLGVIGLSAETSIFLTVSLIWAAHIAFDRVLGYGLKYGDHFKHTHLSAGPPTELESVGT